MHRASLLGVFGQMFANLAYLMYEVSTMDRVCLKKGNEILFSSQMVIKKQLMFM